jgi:chromosome partitioning protein
VGKTTTAVNVGVLLAGHGQRVLVIDTDPQFALTRQLGLGERMLGVNLVDVLAGRALAQDAIVTDVHGVDMIPAARELAGVEMSLVAELGRERFLHDVLGPVLESYDQVVIDTPPNLGLLTVNALVCADRVLHRSARRTKRRSTGFMSCRRRSHDSPSGCTGPRRRCWRCLLAGSPCGSAAAASSSY